MTCHNCGNTMPSESRYCSYCGKKVRSNDEDEFLALNRRKNNYLSEKECERSSGIYARISAKASWDLASQLYQENLRKTTGERKILSKAYCPPEARFEIEKNAECIMKALDAVYYRNRVERGCA